MIGNDIQYLISSLMIRGEGGIPVPELPLHFFVLVFYHAFEALVSKGSLWRGFAAARDSLTFSSFFAGAAAATCFFVAERCKCASDFTKTVASWNSLWSFPESSFMREPSSRPTATLSLIFLVVDFITFGAGFATCAELSLVTTSVGTWASWGGGAALVRFLGYFGRGESSATATACCSTRALDTVALMGDTDASCIEDCDTLGFTSINSRGGGDLTRGVVDFLGVVSVTEASSCWWRMDRFFLWWWWWLFFFLTFLAARRSCLTCSSSMMRTASAV